MMKAYTERVRSGSPAQRVVTGKGSAWSGSTNTAKVVNRKARLSRRAQPSLAHLEQVTFASADPKDTGRARSTDNPPATL
jgi:hypothetical protein